MLSEGGISGDAVRGADANAEIIRPSVCPSVCLSTQPDHNRMPSSNQYAAATASLPICRHRAGGSSGQHAGLRRRSARVQVATAATLSGNSLRKTVHTDRASVHQAAILVAALLRAAGVTAGMAESNGSLPSGL